MTSRRCLKIPSLVLALSSAAALASCSSSLPVESVVVSGERRLPAGVTTQLIAIASVDHGRLLHDVSASATWTSSDASVASVAVARQGRQSWRRHDPRHHSGVSGTLDVAVTDARLTGIDLGPGFTLPAGIGKRLTATGTFSDLTTRDLTTSVTWTTSVPSVATVSDASGSSGLVTSVAPGAATITATDPRQHSRKHGGHRQLGPARVGRDHAGPESVPLGTHQQFTAVGTYTDSTTQDITASVRWSSSSLAVATVATAGAAGVGATATPGVASTTATGTAIISATDPLTGISTSRP